MPYDDVITTTEAGALIPEEVSNAMLDRVNTQSAVLSMFRRIPVARRQVRFPVLSALPLAYWVNGDTGLKQTTKVAWANKFLNIEEIATIVPIPENVASDMTVDVWGQVRSSVEEAIARTLDEAVFFGVNAPSTFPTNVSAAAAAAGNTNAEGALAAAGGINDDIDETIGLLEVDGFDPTGIVASTGLRGKARRARDADGNRLMGWASNYAEYDGLPVAYPMRGLWPSGTRALMGAWDEFVVGVRQDISYKLLDQAVITDNTGQIVFNLPQQDMVALRVTARFGWQVRNLINHDQPTEASRYPAARMTYTP